MKIAFILTSLANKGPILMAQALVQNLIQRGCHCDVYYFDPLLDLEFPCKTEKIKFTDKINFSAYEIIHSHLFRPDLYCAFHKRSIRKAKAKWLSTVHTAIYDDLHYTYGPVIAGIIIPIWRQAWKKTDQAVVLTQVAKEYYKNTKFGALTVISNGVDLPMATEPVPDDDLQLLNEFKEHYHLLGTVCAMDKRKGLDQLLELLVREKKYALAVVGDGEERASLEALALQQNLADRFKVLGYRPRGFRYMSHFDLYLMPSKSEGMPIALLEAMASKVPVVCSDIPAISKEFGEETFSFFQLNDAGSLEEACKYALLNSKQLTDSAYDTYANHYTASQMGLKYYTLYRDLTNIS